MLKTFTMAALLAALAAPAFADEVIIHREREVPVEVLPPQPDAVVIERRRPDCTTSRTTTRDETGASSTVTRKDCD